MKKKIYLPALLVIAFFGFVFSYSYAENIIVLVPGQSQTIGNATVICSGEQRSIDPVYLWTCECHFDGGDSRNTYRSIIHFEHGLKG